MDIAWYEEFLNLYFKGHRKEAYKHKHIHIPLKLFKYQPYAENRLTALSNNKMWFTIPNEMNDPFDSRGMCWNFEEISALLKTNLSPSKLNEFKSIDSIIDGSISSLRDNIKITCFSEELFSMPMWAHYAGNHTGFCIEYDFTGLNWWNSYAKYLFPVGYETHRYDITNLLKLTFNEVPDSRIKLLFFLMQIKHKSWAYEKEWRIIRTRLPKKGTFCSGLENCPLIPKAIYLGINFDKSKTNEFKQRLNGLGIPIYILRTNNSQFFDMEFEQV